MKTPNTLRLKLTAGLWTTLMERGCARSVSRSAAAGLRHSRVPENWHSSPLLAGRNLAMGGLLAALLWLLPASAKAQAIQAWVQRYNGPGNVNDSLSAMAVDTNGNVYVTGTSYNTSVDPPDYATIKYSSAGVPLWTNFYNGPGNSGDVAYALALDPSGNVVVTGYSQSNNYSVFVTIKYSSVGVPLWTNRYNGPGNAGRATRIAVDSNGNVFVTGPSADSGGIADYATIKYSSAGVAVWTNRYNGPGNGVDWPNGLVLDASGSLVVTGRSMGSGTDYDYATIKYSAEGVLLWVRRYNGPVNGYDEAIAVAVDASGDVIVTGRSDGSANAWNDDYLTIKYSSAGVPLWTNRYTALPDHDDQATALAVDANGNVIVTGFSHSNDVECDYATIKYSSAGVPLWTNRYQGPGIADDFPRAVTVDAGGNAYVTGTAWWGDATGRDMTTVAYASSGTPLWTNRYNGPGNYADDPRAIAVDASGNVLVAGVSWGGDSSYDDFATIKYVVPPVVTRQPLSCTNAVGTTATFTVEAAGGLPLNYQWRRQETNLVNGGNLSGVTTTNLLVANVQVADATGHSVVVTNAYGSTTSSVAQLTVYIPPNPGRFTNLSYSPLTGFSFIFRDGTVGRPYRIQVSSSLTGGWLDWQSFNYLGPVGFSDLGALETTNRFYRAVSP